MARRLLLPLGLAFALVLSAAASAGGNYGDQKASVDARLNALHTKIAREQATESSLSSQIGSLTSRIHTLEQKVGDVSSRLASLQSDLELHQQRLDKLNELYHVQTVRFRHLKHEYTLALNRLDVRLINIYKQAEPTTVDVLLAARTFNDVLDQLDYLNAIAAEDKRVAAQVATAKAQIRRQRAATTRVRATVRHEASVIGARVQQQAILRGELLSSRGQLANTRSSKNSALVATKKEVQSEIEESQALAQASATLAAKLRGSDTSSGSAPAGNGTFAWPLSGPITSPFGMRWGTLHPGIDIGVPEGTAIHAAGSGTVVWCGWMSGYGNLVMIDHHNGLATLYGHESRIAASCGEQVTTGQVIGYTGCTGFCTGPHLHFEVRLNGSPVDPLGYLS
jgi:murein DD-endopeptidase MepM/ murein hydrolase activator NlpD